MRCIDKSLLKKTYQSLILYRNDQYSTLATLPSKKKPSLYISFQPEHVDRSYHRSLTMDLSREEKDSYIVNARTMKYWDAWNITSE